jgi:hypothetical protein
LSSIDYKGRERIGIEEKNNKRMKKERDTRCGSSSNEVIKHFPSSGETLLQRARKPRQLFSKI